jgi:hypothetical protein
MGLLCLFICVPIFFIPAIIGSILIAKGVDLDLSRMAGWLTLKPILTTPVWLVSLTVSGILLEESPSPERAWILAVISILPGASLTMWTVLVFRATLFRPRAYAARLLVVLDCARWLNSFLLTLDSADWSRSGDLIDLIDAATPMIGIAMPAVFAIIAYVVARKA